MNDDLLLEPPDEQLASHRDAIFANVISAHNAERAYNKERSNAGWWIGGIGAAIGVLGVAAAAIVAVSHQPQVQYREIEDASGTIRASFGAKDAPDHFSERVIKHYLSEYVGLRERFVWAIDPETDRRIKLMSSPAEQARYAADREHDAPGTKYGVNGYSRIIRFIAMTLRGKGKDKTFEYDVQFVKGELLSSNPNSPVETRMTARIVVQFHPEIEMSQQDRYDNEAGLYVISYGATADDR